MHIAPLKKATYLNNKLHQLKASGNSDAFFIFRPMKLSIKKITFPFDPFWTHHLLIGLLLFIWIFVFLYFTEPLDVKELGHEEQLLYLPGYGLIGGLCYCLFLPYQALLYKINNRHWYLWTEILFLSTFVTLSIAFARLYYLFVVMAGEPNPYSFGYMLTAIFIPATLTILPIVIICRYAFGKYDSKRIDNQKIEIDGEGHYEGLRLLWEDLILIQSSDNYIEVFYRSGDTLKKTLIRNKLSVIEDTHKDLLRTHRSYLINPFHFESWKTENGKHFLQLTHSIKVPISKTYLNAIKSQLDFATH